MQSVVNVLGTLTVGLCALLLLRAYARVRQRLLLWSGLCFAGLTISNSMLFVDLELMPEVSIYPARLSVAAVSMLLLLYGLVFGSD
jgi:fluoride ion exporter CrcB/FEX